MKTEKNKIRQEIRQKLKQLSATEKNKQSTNIWQKIEQHSTFQIADTVLFYWSLPDEVNTQTFIRKWAAQKSILLPVVQGNELVLRKYNGLLKCGAFGICEPEGEDFTDFGKIGLCIVPALAFDRAGNRLGRGKGFYDRLLPKITAPKAGVCFNVQLIDNVPHEVWDIKMDFVFSPL